MVAIEALERVDPRALRAHPDQVATYGAVGGAHDGAFDDLRARIEQTRAIAPVFVTRATPGLARDTIVSGHRRVAVALALGMAVPVVVVEYPDATEAKAAFLAFNSQREKDEWVRTQEALAWRDVEAARAKKRHAQGSAIGGKGGKVLAPAPEPSDAGTTRAKVAARLGEGEKTTELRFKLAEKAREQNPADPSDSPVARALKSNTPVKTVARDHGVIKPDVAKDRRASVLALADRLLNACDRPALERAYGEAARLAPALSEKESEEIQVAYRTGSSRVAARPAAPVAEAGPRAALPKMPDLAAPMAGLRWSRELAAVVDRFAREWTDALARRPVFPEAVETTESEAARALDLILDHLPADARPAGPNLSVVRGGK